MSGIGITPTCFICAGKAGQIETMKATSVEVCNKHLREYVAKGEIVVEGPKPVLDEPRRMNRAERRAAAKRKK